jgi:hypothetical protein
MNTIIDLFRNLWNLLACVGELLGYLLRFASVFFHTRVSLAARLLAAESQLGICKRRVEQKGSPRPKFTAGFRLLWVVLSKFWAPWQAKYLMEPWDAAVSKVLAECKYEPPDWVQDLKEEHDRRVRAQTRKRRSLIGNLILDLPSGWLGAVPGGRGVYGKET